MADSVGTNAVVPAEGVERVFVGIPDVTPESLTLRQAEFEVGMRIQALSFAKDRHTRRESSVSEVLAEATVIEAYLRDGTVPPADENESGF